MARKRTPPPGDPDQPPVSTRLRTARDAAGLSQSEAASRMPGDVKAQYWSDVETGRKNPTLEWLYDAALALRVSPHTLDPRLARLPAGGARKPMGRPKEGTKE